MEIVSVADLKIGMFVAEPDCSWSEFTFALQGFVISTPEQVDIFQTKCRFVYVDRSRSLNEHYAAPRYERDPQFKSFSIDKVSVDKRYPRRQSDHFSMIEERQTRRRRFLNFLHAQKDNEDARGLAQELGRIEPRYDILSSTLQDAFRNFSAGVKVDAVSLREGLRDVAASLQRNPDAVMWLIRLKQCDEYSFDHAMEVSATMVLIGAHIGWRGQKLLDLGLAGLLQDIGKTQLPVELLAKTEPLSPEEKVLVRSHVATSMELLYAQGGIASDVIVTVSRHHERWDGSGYPRGLKYEQIGLAAEIAGLADSFCAMLKDKPYRSALGHQEALEELHGLRNKQFNPVLMEQFVQCIGLYPIGTLVELNTGEVGVVIQQNRVQRSRPRVVVMLDAEKTQVKAYHVIDLREEANAGLRVAKALPRNAYGITANDYYLG